MLARQAHVIRFPWSGALLPATTLVLLILSAAAWAQQRAVVPRGGSLRAPQTQAVAAGLVTNDMATGGETPVSLVTALLGTGVSVGNIVFDGGPVAAGTFSGGAGIVGFSQGIVLSSGDIASVVGPQNLLASTSTDHLRPGDADLDALVGGLTQDACLLEFDFQCPTTTVVSFQYVFASEEYDEWVDTQYNDVFAFILNGENIALLPGTLTPVAINNVNCGNPYVPGGGVNCAVYTTNDCDSLGLGFPCTALATEMDGITSVFSAVGTLVPGPNHIKLVVADRGDGIYDTNVFLRGQSFVCGEPGPAFDSPSPCGQTLPASVGTPFRFEVHALATSGLPGEAVTVDVTGDPAPLAGGVFVPPLPVGPAPEVSFDFEWTPTAADVGLHHLVFTATDQIAQTSSCEVWIDVAPSSPTWTDLGHAKPGIKGPPELLGSGPLSAGSDNTIELANGNRSSPAALVIGLTQLGAPFKDGIMVPYPHLFIWLTTDSGGNLNLGFVWPSGVPAGASLYFQYWIQDSSASYGFCASNGLKGVTH